MDFRAFTDAIEKNGWRVHGVEVYCRGELIHSWGDTAEGLYEIYSATKSVLSMAVGIAWDRGVIDLNHAVTDYLPPAKLARMPQPQRDAFDQLTFQRLLTMSVPGFPFRPYEEGTESWLDFALACPAKPQEMVFHYNNVAPYLVGVALSEALGQDLGWFIEQEILAPLGIDRFEYGRCPEGYFYGASQMILSVNSLSRLGLLLLGGGMYEGKRILSAKYVQRATAVQQMNREGGYGYYLWKYRDGFSINGKWGQKCWVLPREGIMVTMLAHLEKDSHSIRECMEHYILDS